MDKRKINALSQLSIILDTDEFVIVGATALSFYFNSPPVTEDLDLSIAMDIDDLPMLLKKLPSWRGTSIQHRFISTEDLRIDLLPVGPKALAANEIKWPESGERLNLIGFRLVFENPNHFEIADGLTVQVASVPVIALLKFIAYADRPAERRKDLRDLVFILENYIDVTDERRWSDEAMMHSLDFDETTWFVCGLETGGLVNNEERNSFDRFAEMVKDENDTCGTQAQMLRYCPASFNDDPEELMRRFEAFCLGFRSST